MPDERSDIPALAMTRYQRFIIFPDLPYAPIVSAFAEGTDEGVVEHEAVRETIRETIRLALSK